MVTKIRATLGVLADVTIMIFLFELISVAKNSAGNSTDTAGSIVAGIWIFLTVLASVAMWAGWRHSFLNILATVACIATYVLAYFATLHGSDSSTLSLSAFQQATAVAALLGVPIVEFLDIFLDWLF